MRMARTTSATFARSRLGTDASPIRTMAVVMAPGPANIGMPMGTTPTASLDSASSCSLSVSFAFVRSPCIMVKAMLNSRTPPAIRKAWMVVWKTRKM